ncbi:MAG: hypothetical protein A3D41_03315 [Candidatus Sungbacteria bacterium RIFCSPHIGHO2_02_FULL_41_12b]|nr:MAG: hypothetical protein A3D41_03315 [Candidatus Sungbacteria bacterium RIFCSPHIGHO2_02_FULL_41_12b]
MFKKYLIKNIFIYSPIMTEFSLFIPSQLKLFAGELNSAVWNWAAAESRKFFEDSDWQELVFIKLRNILVHAGRNVPYWRRIFREIGFNPQKFKNFEDFQKLPVITRKKLKKIPIEELIAKNISKKYFIQAATSGSTAEPLKFFQDGKIILLRRLFLFYELNYPNFRDGPFLLIGLQTIRHLNGLGYQVGGHKLEDDNWRIKIFYPNIRSFRPRYILSTPSYLKRFIFFCQRDGFTVDRLAGVFCYGEHFGEEERRSVEAFLGCPAYAVYGSQECSLIASQCAKYNYHVAHWMNYVEIIDDNDKPVSRGVLGRIVITSLMNETMPFIRYQLGDLGRLSSGKCLCGNSSPIIEIEGRIVGNIEFSDGTAFPLYPILQYLADHYSSEIKQFQIEQMSKFRLIFRYIPMYTGQSLDFERVMTEYLNSIVRNRMDIKMEVIDYIFPNQNGKTPIFIKR